MITRFRATRALKEECNQQREREINTIEIGIIGFQGCFIPNQSIVYCSEHLFDSTISKADSPKQDDCNGRKCKKIKLTRRHALDHVRCSSREVNTRCLNNGASPQSPSRLQDGQFSRQCQRRLGSVTLLQAPDQMHIGDVQLRIPDRVSASKHHPRPSTLGDAFCKGFREGFRYRAHPADLWSTM